jgi:ATP-binding cassette, subfamily B, bacterial PglK
MKLLIEQVKQSLSYLDRREKTRLSIAILVQIVLALLDMAAAASLGIVGVIAAVSITNSSVPNSVLKLENALGIANFAAAVQITILSLVTVVLFILKTAGSLYLNRKVLLFLAGRQVHIAREIWNKLLRGDYLTIARYPRQELAQAITDSLNISIIGVLGNFILAFSELILLSFLFILLSVLYPAMAILILLTLGTLAFLTQNLVGEKTRKLNAEYSLAAVASKAVLMDALSALPEIKVSGHFSTFIDKFAIDRANAAGAYVRSLWLGQVPKYVLEIGLVFSGFILFFFTQETSTAIDAIGKIAVFLTVSSRLVPSILRLQALLISLHANTGISKSINTLQEELLKIKNSTFNVNSQDSISLNQIEATVATEILLEGVSFRYMHRPQTFEFGDISIPRGKTIAILGRSGVGKTTLVQLILGLIEPITGSVKLDGLSPRNRIAAKVGSITYLPQSVAIVSGSIAENVALGIPLEDIDEDRLWDALEVGALIDWVDSQPGGLTTSIDQAGLNLSGGQLQRIGIARAVYSRPNLIVLDEPTSSLDEKTENAFLSMLENLRGQTTILMITHKLATLDYVDGAILLEESNNLVTARLLDPKSAQIYEQKNIFEG